MNLGMTIKSIRKERCLTQEELASRSGLDQAFISQIENGQRTPSTESLFALGQALDIPSSYISVLATEKEDLLSPQAWKMTKSIQAQIRRYCGLQEVKEKARKSS